MAAFEENTIVREFARVERPAPSAHRIERIELSRHSLPLEPPFRAAWDSRPRETFDVGIVRVITADGMVGIGAGAPMAGIEDYLDLFIGQDPLNLDRHQAILTNIDFHAGRPWPLDIALWDLAGKIREEPVWRLLGGASGKIRTYASTGVLHDAKDLAKKVVKLVEQGFPAVKVRFNRKDWRLDVAAVEAVRVAIGDSAEILVDCNQGWRMPWDTEPSWTYHQALVVARELEALGVYWMEEPVHRGDYRAMTALRSAIAVRIAGGELTREAHSLRRLIERRCVDVLQPDATMTCGIAGLMEIARLARHHDVSFTPHSWGSGIGLLANAHLMAGCNGGPWLEFPCDPPDWTAERRDFMLAEPVTVDEEGCIELSSEPGFGIELDEERLASFKVG